MDINELKQKRAALIKQARELHDEITKREDPVYTAEEQNKYDAIMKDIDSYSDQIKKEEDLRSLEKIEAQKKLEIQKTTGDPPKDPPKEERDLFYRDKNKAGELFGAYLRSGPEFQAVSQRCGAVFVSSR